MAGQEYQKECAALKAENAALEKAKHEAEKRGECSVCLSERATCVFTICGHQCVCPLCMYVICDELLATGVSVGDCPLCRARGPAAGPFILT